MLWTKESRVGDRHLRVISEGYTLLSGGENMPTWITLKKPKEFLSLTKKMVVGFFFLLLLTTEKK